jgi:type IV secretion system protein VirB10
VLEEKLPQEYDDNQDEFGNEDYNADSDLDTGGSAVAISKTSKVLGVIILSLVVITVLYLFFSGEKEKVVAKEQSKKVKIYDKEITEQSKIDLAPLPSEELNPIIDTFSPEEEVVLDVVNLKVPELPNLEVAELPASEDFNVMPKFSEEDLFSQASRSEDNINNPNNSAIDLNAQDSGFSGDSFANQQFSARGEEGTSMMLFNGGDVLLEKESENLIADSGAEASIATKIKFPDRTIAQGKLVDSVLETAINSDFAGKVRAIISRDIYSDFSNNILIPKGSRLIGSYQSSVARGQTRVFITWERLIRPDAIDIQIDSPASDQFGRVGIGGNVNNRYLELFNNSMLLSLITVGAAAAAEGLTDGNGVSREQKNNGDEVITGTASDLAAEEVVANLSKTAKTILDGAVKLSPTITIPQGTRVKIFVNKDLIFPKLVNSTGNSDIIFIK